MHTLIRFTLMLVCATILIAFVRESKCEEAVGSAGAEEVVDVPPLNRTDAEVDDDKKDGKLQVSGSNRRPMPTPSSSSNGTRDSQLLSLLAARRRQLFNGRLTTHLSTIATLSHKPYRNNTRYAQLELRDSNSSTVKRIVLENEDLTNKPALRIETTSLSKELQTSTTKSLDTRLLGNKTFQASKSRAGFLNNRRKEALDEAKDSVNSKESEGHGLLIAVPDEKLEGPEHEALVDPEEEFQVDESNHGVYLLNYTDSNNGTDSNQTSTQTNTKAPKIVSKDIEFLVNSTSLNEPEVIEAPSVNENGNSTKVVDTIISFNETDKTTEITKTESGKENGNNTQFISDELYNHFRPMETELPVEDMAPFLFFGQKINGPVLNSDNLTDSPTLSASTKSVNLVVSPYEKRKYTSRYSATDKIRNSSVDEEEVNEEMDVSVVKNIIEKNKVRNSVKVPARQLGLVNAYRKQSTPTTQKFPNISELNTTDNPINHNSTSAIEQFKEPQINKTINQSAKNYTRSYYNIRQRPARVAATSTESTLVTPKVNITTEKPSTLVYTAVVTSVSITSSMKGQNKTENLESTPLIATNDTIVNSTNIPTEIALTLNETETTTAKILNTVRPLRHRLRIRTSTTDRPKTTALPIISNRNNFKDSSETTSAEAIKGLERSELEWSSATKHTVQIRNTSSDVNVSETSTRQPTSSSTFRNIYRRRRPTTTSTTTSTTTPKPTTVRTTLSTSVLPIIQDTHLDPVQEVGSTMIERTTTPLVITTRSASESTYYTNNNENSNDNFTNSNQPLKKSVNETKEAEKTEVKNNNPNERNEEVVIEAEKTYTASYILAGLGFLPVMAIIIFVLRNFMAKKTKELDTEYEGYFDDGEIKKESPITPVARAPMPPPAKPDQKWEFPRNKLRLQTLLGQGNFGQVWKAEADDLTGHDGLTRLVAVKSIKETASQKEKQELLHEICIMQKIGTHPNVVTLLACCTEQEPYLLIMEYVMCGKLLTYLRERRSRPDRFGGSGALTSRDLTVFAYCVARGMDYLASKGIVHRDLAARNVLVDHNKLCKIADFGMSRELGSGEERGQRVQRHALPVRWMAPEALLYNLYNHETDVWAYGILLWEIVTLGSTPYAAMSGREVLAAVSEGYRLERPPHCKPQLYRAMHACWHADPNQRPPFRELRAQLAVLLENEPSEGHYVDLDSFYQESSVYSDPSAIIPDDRLSAEYEREARTFRENAPSSKYDGRGFGFRNEDLRNNFGIGSPRMGGFGIRDIGFNVDQNFNERKEIKLSTSSFHRERERENPLVSRNSFSGGFPRLASRDYQFSSDGRNQRVPEFECDI